MENEKCDLFHQQSKLERVAANAVKAHMILFHWLSAKKRIGIGAQFTA